MTYAITFAAEQRLQFRFKPGDKFSLVSVTEQKTSRAAPILGPESRDASRSEPAKMGAADANEGLTQQTLRLRSDLDIDEVEENGCAWAKYTYRQVALKVREKDLDIDYDSDVSQQKIPQQVLPFYFALGETFFVRITPQGRITNVNGLSAVVGNAKSKVPNIAVRDQITEAIDRQFAEDKIILALEDQLAVFPDANSGQISIGDTWSRRKRSDEDKISLEWSFRLKERRDEIVIVDVNVIVISGANKAPIFIGEMRAKREISGQGTGQIEIEQSSGRIINSTLNQDLVEKITFLPEGAIRRPPPAPAPGRTHIVTTFQMIKRDSDQPPASPDASRGGPEPNQP